MGFQIMALIILLMFYTIYVGKMIIQRKKGIKTDQMGKGSKPKNVVTVEIIMKISTYSIVLVQVLSIYKNTFVFSFPFRIVGSSIALIGVATFAVSVWTMRDSWRAGIDRKSVV